MTEYSRGERRAFVVLGVGVLTVSLDREPGATTKALNARILFDADGNAWGGDIAFERLDKPQFPRDERLAVNALIDPRVVEVDK